MWVLTNLDIKIWIWFVHQDSLEWGYCGNCNEFPVPKGLCWRHRRPWKFRNYINRGAIRKRKANWIGHILRRNCLLKQVIEGKIKGEIELTRRQGRRRKKLLDDLKDRRGYCHLKEEALDRRMWGDRFGRGFEPVVRQSTGWWWFIVENDQNSHYAMCSSVILFR